MLQLLFLFIPISWSFQPADTVKPTPDTTVLENIIVNAYENNYRLIEVAAPVSVVQNRDFNRYNNLNIVAAMNVAPGVRMEERSPGSYRFNIRGSSLRSPFGVRNVKIYWNGVPFTDPGGNTYLNQLDFYNVESAEIIKGPAGSIYGAGTGGVILLNSEAGTFKPGIRLEYTGGSYNTHHANVKAGMGNEERNHTLNFSHVSSDGYREHTTMRRDAVHWTSRLKKTEKSELSAWFFYGDMYYQTPGGLTREEFEKNPRAARPKTAIHPSAQEAQASFRAHTFYTAFHLKNTLSEFWRNSTSVYGAYSQNRNPNFRNFSRTSEPHMGARTVFSYARGIFRANAGAEFQKSFNGQRVYKNNSGGPGALQTDDEIFNTTGFIFGQALADVDQWRFTLGASYNDSKLEFRRFSDGGNQEEERNFNNQLAPRLAVLRKLNENSSVYVNVAGGFSAPATSELLPSTDVFNMELQPETGINYEAGLKSLLLKKVYLDVNVFYYSLTNAIIQLRDATGGDYFENAGSARQAGIETFLNSTFLNRPGAVLSYGNAYLSNTIFDFKYKNYESGGKDYSGNKLPGVASHTLAIGVDLRFFDKLSATVTWFQSGKIALNDANQEWAKRYHLLGFKVGYDLPVNNTFKINIFAGGQNLLDETYSLGNDINAFGGRYYNAAPGRNFYAGLRLQAW